MPDESFLPQTTMPAFYYRGPQNQVVIPSALNPRMPGMSGLGGLGESSQAAKYGGVALSIGAALVAFSFAFKASGLKGKLPWLVTMTAAGAGAYYLLTKD